MTDARSRKRLGRGVLALSMLAFGVASNDARAKDEPKVILAIFAHPDDDTGPGAALARYAAAGARVHVAYVTDGRYGVRAGFGVPVDSDELVQLRQEEARCAAKARGTETPVFFGFPDQIVGNAAILEQMQRLNEAAARVAEEIERVKPDVVVTFGPGGYTGHPDHRLVGDLVEQAMFSRDWGSTRLYEFSPSNGQIEAMGRAFPLVGQAEATLNVAVTFGETERAKEAAALRCYASQFSEEQMQAILDAEARDQTNTRRFREIQLTLKKREGF